MDIARDECRSIPFGFVWNIDDTRGDSPKKTPLSNVIISACTKPGMVTVCDEEDNAQLRIIAATSAFRDSTSPTFISKNKTLDKTSLAVQQLFDGYDYAGRTEDETFIMKVLFIDPPQNLIVSKVACARERTKHSDKVVLIVDRNTTHVSP
jgi:hypothetical protein